MKILNKNQDEHTRHQFLYNLSSNTDCVGIFGIDRKAVDNQMKLFQDDFVRYFPLINDHYLSRGSLYYNIENSLESIEYIISMLEGKYELDQQVISAFYENITNVLMSLIYDLWSKVTEQTSKTEINLLTKLIEVTKSIACEHLKTIYEIVSISDIDWQFVRFICQTKRFAKLRMFREVDNKIRIIDEIKFASHYIVDKYNIEFLLFPLYGALSMGIYWAAYDELFNKNKKLQIYFAKIGFHDQAGSSYVLQDGTIQLNKIMPREFYDSFCNGVKGKKCLIVDDNFAMGETFEACKKIVSDAGGIGYTRSIESSWSYFEYNKRDSTHYKPLITVDFPSLRTYFHHSKQVSLISYLAEEKYEKYLNESLSINDLQSISSQISENYFRALKIVDWPKHTLSVMRNEVEYSHYWLAKNSPEKVYT